MVAHSPPFEALAARVASLLDGAVIVAHNAPFDLSFVSREFAAAGLRMPSSPAIDTLVLARRRFPSGGNNLGSVARRLGVRVPAHRALADVLTTREVFWRLVEPITGRSATIGDALRVQGSLAPDADDESAEAAGGSTSSGGEEPKPALAADLVRALRGGERVRVLYRGSSGKTTERTIDPMTVVDYGGECVVVAYCHLRRAERTFTVSRIVSWVATAELPSGRSSGGD
jgi:DNA polymerase-3 subunit epsilon